MAIARVIGAAAAIAVASAGVAMSASRGGSSSAPSVAQAYAAAPRNIVGVEMRSSCAAEAAADVDRGVAFLFALAPNDARRAFERAADADASCAFAGWGRALTWLPDDPLSLDEAARGQARDGLRRVLKRGTPRERAYVASAMLLFDDPAEVPMATRLRSFQESLRDLVVSYPDDGVAAVMYARATLWRSAMPDDEFRREAASIIERRFGTFASKPASASSSSLDLGAALTLLLARDRPQGAQLAKPAADAVSRLATLPLVRHLPARTYARLGDWDAAVATTEAAIALAGSPASPELVYGDHRDQVAIEWLFDAYLQQGRFARAGQLRDEAARALDAGVGNDDPDAIDALRGAIVRMRIREVLARAEWPRGRESQAQALGCPGTVTGACTFIEAYAAARLAFPGAKADMIDEAARVAEPLGGMGTGGPATVTELWRVLVRAAIAAGQEEHHELELLASYAIELEERLSRSGQLTLPLAPANELVGDLFLQINRFEEARRRYRDALLTAPNHARSLLGVARASARLNDRAGATAAYRQLLTLWSHADTTIPELTEASQWVNTEKD